SLKSLDLVAAGDYADLRVVVAADPHPARPDPVAVARDQRLARRQLAATSHRGCERLGHVHACQQWGHVARSAHAREQRVVSNRGSRRTRGLDQRKAAFSELGQPPGDVFDAANRDRLQVRPEHRFDGPLPARLDDEVLRETMALGKRLSLEPAPDLLRRRAECDVLQCLERGEADAIVFELLPKLIQMLRDVSLLLPQLLYLLRGRLEGSRSGVECGDQSLLVPDQRRESAFDVCGAQSRPLFGVPLALLLEPVTLDTQLLGQRVLDARRAFGGRELLADLSRALAPALEDSLGVLELELRRALQSLRLLEPGRELTEQLVELRELDLVARDVRLNFGDLRVGALQILGLPLDQLLAVLNGLLETRDLGADLVVAPLHGVESLAAIG